MNEGVLLFLFSMIEVLFYVGLGGGWLYLGYEMVMKMLYPIPIVILRNAGGGHDNRSAALHPKVFLRGRIRRTEYGERMEIRGIRETVPLEVFSREHAHPYKASVGYIIYEKEFNQFFPTGLKIISEGKEHAAKVKEAYQKFMEDNPELARHVRIDYKAKKSIEPVAFANTTVKLQPFPLDAITPFSYNVKARNARVLRGGFFEKYMPFIALGMVIVAFIVGMVLFFEWTADRMDTIAGNMHAENQAFGERIASTMERGSFNNGVQPAEQAPGGG